MMEETHWKCEMCSAIWTIKPVQHYRPLKMKTCPYCGTTRILQILSRKVSLVAHYIVSIASTSEREAERKAGEIWGSWSTPGAVDTNLEICEVVDPDPGIPQ